MKSKQLNPILIETQRLKLHGYRFLDIKFIFENYNKAEIMEILGHRSDDDFQKEEYKYLNGYASYNRNFILFLLIEKESKLIIGRCGLHNWNEDHKRAEIGYNMSDEDFKRKGLMNEAVEHILAYGFNQLSLQRIEAIVGANNFPSLKIIQKHRFCQEGVLRKHSFSEDKFEDSILFSLLQEEYIAFQQSKNL